MPRVKKELAEQIAAKLREGDVDVTRGKTVAEAVGCCRNGVRSRRAVV